MCQWVIDRMRNRMQALDEEIAKRIKTDYCIKSTLVENIYVFKMINYVKLIVK